MKRRITALILTALAPLVVAACSDQNAGFGGPPGVWMTGGNGVSGVEHDQYALHLRSQTGATWARILVNWDDFQASGGSGFSCPPDSYPWGADPDPTAGTAQVNSEVSQLPSGVHPLFVLGVTAGVNNPEGANPSWNVERCAAEGIQQTYPGAMIEVGNEPDLGGSFWSSDAVSMYANAYLGATAAGAANTQLITNSFTHNEDNSWDTSGCPVTTPNSYAYCFFKGIIADHNNWGLPLPANVAEHDYEDPSWGATRQQITNTGQTWSIYWCNKVNGTPQAATAPCAKSFHDHVAAELGTSPSIWITETGDPYAWGVTHTVQHDASAAFISEDERSFADHVFWYEYYGQSGAAWDSGLVNSLNNGNGWGGYSRASYCVLDGATWAQATGNGTYGGFTDSAGWSIGCMPETLPQ